MLLKFAYQDFLDDRRFRNTTEKNIRNYQTMLGAFVEYCIHHEVVSVEDIAYNHVRQHLMECQERGNKAGSINTKIMRIRAFLNYMVECEVITKNPAKRVKMQKEDVKTNVFSDEQIRQMLNFYRRIKQRDKNYVAYRDYMMIVTLLGTGIRRGEIINLKWSDIDFINQTIAVFGKSRRRDTLPITDKLSKELAAYNIFCKQHWGDLSDYVFVKRDNTQMTENSLMLVFKYLGQKMNFIDVRVSAHTFRHTFCHRLAMSGMSAVAIQKLMRHQNITVTMRYVSMWGNELRLENDKYNPLNSLNI
ncbi:tyrosine-type recombinase/integrase [Paenibacillus crassostreae]|uniref:Integrase n=1 Tax=Paenibacillus crassostreae TaxID=1763538 RepID=A0A167AGA8_9BACL|nr:tyrosine-type recombinase/integrase [Paenibacillus crassostreae]AOZ92270.1 integrase [Paenibacillus crassostreae]OAB70987.1 integrase [Paenibacillus crassostreae]